jgi:transposase
MEDYKIIAINLAKTIFHICAINAKGERTLQKKLHRDELLHFIRTTFPKGLTVAMEACAGCHYWGQQLEALGFKVLLLKTKDVQVYAKSRQKNDNNDALAIAKAAMDPELKAVNLKTVAQQTICFLHKTRGNTIANRVQKSNSIMSSLMEFGVVTTAGKTAFAKHATEYIKQAYKACEIPEEVYVLLQKEANEITELLAKEALLDSQIKAQNKLSPRAKLLETIPGIGPINASILSIQPLESYQTAKDFAASLGLVPKQFTTGGKVQLGGITKQGNRYVRTMLIQGARSIVMRTCKDTFPDDAIFVWANKLYLRKGFNVACVAVANKLARLAYVCGTRNKCYAA